MSSSRSLDSRYFKMRPRLNRLEANRMVHFSLSLSLTCVYFAVVLFVHKCVDVKTFSCSFWQCERDSTLCVPHVSFLFVYDNIH